jgi:hypothetical protein
MEIRTRVFEFCERKYRNLSEMADAMGLSVSQVYRVKERKRSINQKFIIGAKKAFPEYRLDDLFYFEPNSPSGSVPEPVPRHRYLHIVKQYTASVPDC